MTDHENFLQSMRGMVGKDIRRHVDFNRMDQQKLPNGNTEYRLTQPASRRTKPCTNIYEVDPKTYIIQRADFVGAPADCIIPIGWPG